MQKEDAKNLLYSLLAPQFAEKLFRYRKAGEGALIRSIQDGYQRVGVPIIDREPFFKFSLVLAIRLETVEAIANKFNSAAPKYHSETITFGVRLERFMPGRDIQFDFKTEKDIEIAIARLIPVITDKMIPFLDHTTTLEGLAQEMNLTEIPKMITGTGGGIRALIVANLIRHPGFDDIASAYQQRYNKLPEAVQDQFRKCIKYLKETELASGSTATNI